MQIVKVREIYLSEWLLRIPDNLGKVGQHVVKYQHKPRATRKNLSQTNNLERLHE